MFYDCTSITAMQAVLCKGQNSILKFHRLCCNEYKMLAVHSQITSGSKVAPLKITKNAQYAMPEFIGARTFYLAKIEENIFEQNFVVLT